MGNENSEIFLSFVVESNEMLDDVEPFLIELQKNAERNEPVNPEMINAIFRLFHTIKGTSGFLQLNNLGSVTHEAETYLDNIRKGRLPLISENISLLFSAIDFMRKAMESIETNFHDGGHETKAAELVEAFIQINQEVKSAEEDSPKAVPSQKTGKINIEINDDMIKSYITDSMDLLEKIEQGILDILQGKAKATDLNDVYRYLHTFKGNTGMFGYADIERLGHKTETLLNILKSTKTKDYKVNLRVILKIIEVFRETLQEILMGGDATIKGIDGMLMLLEEIIEEVSDVPEKDEASVEEVATESEIKPEFVNFGKENENVLRNILPILKKAEVDSDTASIAISRKTLHDFYLKCVALNLKDFQRLARLSEGILDLMSKGNLKEFKTNIRVIVKVVDVLLEGLAQLQKTGKDTITGSNGMIALLDDIVKELGEESSPHDNTEATTGSGSQPARVTEPVDRKTAISMQNQFIRIDLTKVDKLVNWVGELSIAELMVMQTPKLTGEEKSNFERIGFEMHRIVTEIQNLALSLRMLPIAGTFNKMTRLVHDLSIKAKKEVKLHISGEETEIDKSVVDYIADPLVHIIRNAIDHGLELAEERLSSGKKEAGNLYLEAKHESGEIWITVRDDGRGINRKKVIEKAIQTGLIKGDGSNLSDRDVNLLIFEPGFSTAEQITEISGRGVGMDVVKQNIEKIKGRIDIYSAKGQGTTIHLRIPLTMALIDGMVVKVGKRHYIIPLLTIREFFQVSATTVTITPDGQEIVQIRQELLPILRLHKIYKIEPEYDRIEDGLLIVIDFQEQQYCLFVDGIVGQQQTVIKAIPDYIEKVRGISGFTILGDGDVCPILDIASLFYMNKDRIF